MKPEKVFRIGLVSASIFANEVGNDDKQRTIRSVSLQRRYLDGDEWKSSTSFGLAELPTVATVVRLATDDIASKEADVTPT
jgi:hypothetical protein